MKSINEFNGAITNYNEAIAQLYNTDTNKYYYEAYLKECEIFIKKQSCLTSNKIINTRISCSNNVNVSKSQR